ncbi:hypothetical protein CN692_18740 [Bacillus sp. AFS002410]|uniref:RecT family recombinase n=1 Tax=Bacillus sp. AFS002410 TaxID=2033481 RepID=UPI000BF0087F|nr:RecT family recombinase [Bacillus sp. AFS002410]PEJ56165.1 hypothetical protein CN692_18740 [Bacillus sp. AFS002410]
MTNQVAIQNLSVLAFGEVTEQDVLTIRETIGKDCNESQFKLFMSIAKASGANPIANEIYPAVRGGQLTVQFGIDYYVRKAKESVGYLGYDVQLVHENDEFKMHQEKGEDGRYFMVIDVHSFGFPRGKVIGGYAFAYKQGIQPFSVLMEVNEVEHFTRSNIGMQKTMWTNYFNDMYKKHMVRRALKAAFELNFEDEQVQGSQLDSYDKPNQRVDITPNQIHIGEGEVIDPEDEMKSRWSEIKSKQVKYSLSEDDLKNIIKVNFNKTPKELTLQQVVGLSKLIDLEGNKKKPAEPEEITFDDLDEF